MNAPNTREAKLERIIDDITNVGIYPASVVGEGGYEKRTEWQEGWNAAVKEMISIYSDSCRREFTEEQHELEEQKA